MFSALCWTMRSPCILSLCSPAAACERYIWPSLLMIQNYGKGVNTLLPQTEQASPHDILKLSLNMREAPCLSAMFSAWQGPLSYQTWPVKKWNIVQSWRIPLSWGRIWRESGSVCMGGIRRGLEVEERGDNDDGQTRGSPPSIKAAGM